MCMKLSRMSRRARAVSGALFACGLLACATGHAADVANGHNLNGSNLNGVNLNGVSVNGVTYNGASVSRLGIENQGLPGLEREDASAHSVKVSEHTAPAIDVDRLSLTGMTLRTRAERNTGGR